MNFSSSWKGKEDGARHPLKDDRPKKTLEHLGQGHCAFHGTPLKRRLRLRVATYRGRILIADHVASTRRCQPREEMTEMMTRAHLQKLDNILQYLRVLDGPLRNRRPRLDTLLSPHRRRGSCGGVKSASQKLCAEQVSVAPVRLLHVRRQTAQGILDLLNVYQRPLNAANTRPEPGQARMALRETLGQLVHSWPIRLINLLTLTGGFNSAIHPTQMQNIEIP